MLMKIGLFTILFFIILLNVEIFAQSSLNFYGSAGLTYGGPIPEKISENSDGNPKTGFNIGIGVAYILNSKFEINSKVNYSFKGVYYSTNYKKDTIIEQVINNNTVKLNSFYTAYVNGDMSFNYIDMHILPSYKISKKITMQLGAYISYLTGGYDRGKVQVVIGEGGFFGDYFEDYDNYSKINKIDYGISLGIKSMLTEKAFWGFNVTRSLRPLYKDDIFIRRGLEENKLYNTYVDIYVGYSIK